MKTQVRKVVTKWPLLLAGQLACLACYSGCGGKSPSDSFVAPKLSALEVAWAGANAAAAVTSGEDRDPIPTPIPPSPTPAPDAECGRCDGTGRIRLDGRIEIDCPDCGGDGKLSYEDMYSIIRLAQSKTTIQSPGMLLTARKSDEKAAELEPLPGNERVEQVLQEPLPREVMQSDSLAYRTRSEMESTSPLVETVPKDAHPIQWLTTLAAGREASHSTGKPAIVYWHGDNCRPCREFERLALNESTLTDFLAGRFACVKVNAQRLNRTPAGRRQLKEWNITSIPQVFLVTPDWKIFRLLKRSNDPQDLVEQLRDAERWTSRRVRAQPATRMAQMVRVRTADLRTLIDDSNGAAGARAETVPLDVWGEDWEARQRDKETGRQEDKVQQPAPVRQVQYTPSGGYGSNGGGGGYRVVVMNGGGYGANGGAYRGGYRSNRGSYSAAHPPAVYGGNFMPAAYYRPRVYYQPAYHNGYYGGGRTIVCGPWGCALQ
jgi:hypothetical protein